MTQRGDIELAKGLNVVDEQVYPETAMLKDRLEWFQDLKMGVIVHWGLYAEAGIVESWQLSEQDEWAREPVAWRDDVKELQRDYWNLIEDFNPINFDAKEWAKTCKEAGFKYILFTTKHHDGFNMFDTQYSDYKITGERSPFKDNPNKDLLKEVFEAFRDEGIAVGAYYSKADWYSEYYWLKDDSIKGRRASYDTEEHPEIWEKYVEFVHNQMHEIMTNYGEVDFLWLDAGWCGQGKEDLRMDELVESLREKQPNLIVVDRMMGGRHENYVTPERKIPEKEEIPNKAWESNIPFGNDWGYVPTDTFKTPETVRQLLVDVVTKGGNIVFGLGPKPDGTFTEEEKNIMSFLGSWLSDNGKAIYGTRSVPSAPLDKDWRLTEDEDHYYVICLDETDARRHITLETDWLKEDVSKASILSDGTPVPLEKTDKSVTIHLTNIEGSLTTVVIQLDKVK